MSTVLTYPDASSSSLAIGRRLQALRKQRGWTQQHVADRLGIRQKRVCQFENTLDDAHKLGTLRRFAALYGVTLAGLVAVAERTERPSR